MTIPSQIRHNQYTLLAAVIALALFAPFLACQLTRESAEPIIEPAAEVARAVIQKKPLPWSDIGIIISAIFGSGVFVDNRRKDILIKRLKTENADKDRTISTALNSNSHPPP